MAGDEDTATLEVTIPEDTAWNPLSHRPNLRR
jgi:hypothetical protein